MNKTAFILIALSLMPIGAFAEDSSIAQLESKVLELEKRIAKLEAKSSGKAVAAPVAAVPTGNYKNIANWRLLKKGMKEDEVRQILGEPTKVDAGYVTFWYYPDFRGGHVQFNDRMRVSGWKEP